MSETYTPPPFAPSPKRSGPNCLLLTAIGCGVLLLLFVLLIVLTFFFARSALRKLVDEWTEPTPITLPESDMDPETYAALRDRFEAFKQGLTAGTADAPLALTGDEINALIQNHPDWETVRGKAHVSLDGDVVRAEVSIPLDGIPLIGAGRYLNGSAAFDVSVDNGVLYVYLAEATVKGRSAPEEMIASFRAENLAADLNRNPEIRTHLRRIKSVRISDGVLHIEPMEGPSIAPEAPVDEAEPGADEASAEPEVLEQEPAAAPL